MAKIIFEMYAGLMNLVVINGDDVTSIKREFLIFIVQVKILIVWEQLHIAVIVADYGQLFLILI